MTKLSNALAAYCHSFGFVLGRYGARRAFSRENTGPDSCAHHASNVEDELEGGKLKSEI